MDKKPIRLTHRELEMRWLGDHREWLEENHPGEWVAVDGDRMVAIGPKLTDVMEAARAAGVENPFVDAVRSKRYRGVQLYR